MQQTQDLHSKSALTTICVYHVIVILINQHLSTELNSSHLRHSILFPFWENIFAYDYTSFCLSTKWQQTPHLLVPRQICLHQTPRKFPLSFQVIMQRSTLSSRNLL